MTEIARFTGAVFFAALLLCGASGAQTISGQPKGAAAVQGNPQSAATDDAKKTGQPTTPEPNAVMQAAAPGGSESPLQKTAEASAPDPGAKKSDATIDALRGDLVRNMVIGAALLATASFLLFLLWAVGSMRRPVAFRTQWGGFGGGVGGWSLSPAAVMLIVACILAGLAVVLLVEASTVANPNRAPQSDGKNTTPETAKAAK